MDLSNYFFLYEECGCVKLSMSHRLRQKLMVLEGQAEISHLTRLGSVSDDPDIAKSSRGVLCLCGRGSSWCVPFEDVLYAKKTDTCVVRDLGPPGRSSGSE